MKVKGQSISNIFLSLNNSNQGIYRQLIMRINIKRNHDLGDFERTEYGNMYKHEDWFQTLFK